MPRRIRKSLDIRLDELLACAISCPDDCLELRERQDKDGYPVLRAYYKDESRTEKVARWLLYRAYGEIIFSKGIVTRHLCNNRLCINLRHLAYGTHQDNSTDMSSSGRATASRRFHRHDRLDQSVQQIIADEYDPFVRNGEKLASEFGITRQRLHQIV